MYSPDPQNSTVDNYPVQLRESVDGKLRVLRLALRRAPSPDNANLHDKSRCQTSTHPFRKPACPNQANRSCLLRDRVGPCPENQPQSHLDLPRAHWPTPHLRQLVQSRESRRGLLSPQPMQSWTMLVRETPHQAATRPY